MQVGGSTHIGRAIDVQHQLLQRVHRRGAAVEDGDVELHVAGLHGLASKLRYVGADPCVKVVGGSQPRRRRRLPPLPKPARAVSPLSRRASAKLGGLEAGVGHSLQEAHANHARC